MNPFSEYSDYTDDSDKNAENSQVRLNKTGFHEFISSILFACSGETTQYEETISAIENSLVCYLHHLSQESVKCARNPHKICSEDVISALKESPQVQNNIISFLDDMKSINSAKNNY